jgi:hypothetical protein
MQVFRTRQMHNSVIIPLDHRLVARISKLQAHGPKKVKVQLTIYLINNKIRIKQHTRLKIVPKYKKTIYQQVEKSDLHI